MSHVTYVRENIHTFWKTITNQNLVQSGCDYLLQPELLDGMVIYKKKWEDHGIHLYHGVLLSLMTYTSIRDGNFYLDEETVSKEPIRAYSDIPNDYPDWVIKNYPRFKNYLPPINYYVWFNADKDEFSDSWYEGQFGVTYLTAERLLNDLKESKSNSRLIRYQSLDNSPMTFMHGMKLLLRREHKKETEDQKFGRLFSDFKVALTDSNLNEQNKEKVVRALDRLRDSLL